MDRAEKVIASVGARIAELRREHGWTQQEAADRMRMEVQSFQRLERGENLTIRSLVRVASFLGVEAIDLFLPPSPRERRPGRPKKPQNFATPDLAAPALENPIRRPVRRKPAAT